MQPKRVRVAMRRFHAIALACSRNFAAGNISGPDLGLQTPVHQVLRSEAEVEIDEPSQTSALQGTTKPTTHQLVGIYAAPIRFPIRVNKPMRYIGNI
jgi:hypothetical protein